MKPFDSYEISPCRRLNDANEPDPNGLTFEVCEPHETHVWTLYGHIPGEGVEAIGDFATRELAEQVFERITGIPFAGSREVMDRLRVMHAGQRLLEALKTILEEAETITYHTPHLGNDFWGDARSAVAAALEEAIMTDQTPNQHRAAYAAEVIDGSRHYESDDQVGVQDLLSDLMHLCREKEYDFAEVLRVATDNFNAEIMDDESEGMAV